MHVRDICLIGWSALAIHNVRKCGWVIIAQRWQRGGYVSATITELLVSLVGVVSRSQNACSLM
jgi:hypothetical protein